MFLHTGTRQRLNRCAPHLNESENVYMKRRILALLLVLILVLPLFPAKAYTSDEAVIWNFFKAQGFSDAGTAGVIGNIQAESGCSPINAQQHANNILGMTDEEFTAAVDSGEISRDGFLSMSFGQYGYGLVQWTSPDRKGGLYDLAKSRGVSIGDLGLQLEYIMKELESYSALKSYLKSAADVTEACDQFRQTYEVTNADISRRREYAAAAYQKYAGTAVTPIATSAPVPTPTPTPQPATVAGFHDVFENNYFANSVIWAVQKGITTGTSKTKFSPNATCTRAQMVTFLWRANGSPAPADEENPFLDVPDGKYYAPAVLWAVEQGITTGTSHTHFSPDRDCTRGQAVTFLWRSNGSPESTVTQNPFADVNSGSYCYNAVLWAIQQGVTTGKSNTKFAPDSACTRAQIVTFLYRDQAARAPE